MKNSRKMRGMLVMLIAFAFCFLAEPVKADVGTALDGIYVEDLSVGGMTEEPISQAINDKIEFHGSLPLSIKIRKASHGIVCECGLTTPLSMPDDTAFDSSR